MRRAMLAAAAAMGFLGTMPAGARAQQADVALVYRLLQDGQMVITPASGAQRPARLGDRLRNRDVVFTSPNTRAALRFTDDGSILRINPSSQVRLTTGEERGALVRTLELEFGEVWARVTRGQGTQFRVQTPAGVAAVKGTEFLVRVDSAGNTVVVTLEGVVEFFNQAGRTDVAAGQRASAGSQSDAPEAGPASPEELRRAGEAGGEDGATAEGRWIEVLLQHPDGRVRTLMIQVPADALRGRVQGTP
ncbi:MAG TPA: FecR family protein [Longimicrobium sp.]|nr:FecR family protein [Longimicrobium sp.]